MPQGPPDEARAAIFPASQLLARLLNGNWDLAGDKSAHERRYNWQWARKWRNNKCVGWEEGSSVREFIYGLIIGAALMYGWERVDVPGIWAYLSGATEHAKQSTSGYGGTPRPRR